MYLLYFLAAYQQIQASLVRSRSRSGDSVSAMSGISSASGGSTLGPLPEERLAGGISGDRPEQSPGGVRKHARVSPLASPKSPATRHLTATRRVSAPPIPDICQLSPPNVQFTLGGTPPTTTTGFSHRRRTSSSSSCGKYLSKILPICKCDFCIYVIICANTGFSSKFQTGQKSPY